VRKGGEQDILVIREMKSKLKECYTVKWQHLLKLEAEGSNKKRKRHLLVNYYLWLPGCGFFTPTFSNFASYILFITSFPNSHISYEAK